MAILASAVALPTTPDDLTALAESIVASYLHPTLTYLVPKTTKTVNVRLWDTKLYPSASWYRSSPAPIFSGSPILRVGPEILGLTPITELVSLFEDSIDLTTMCSFTKFAINLSQIDRSFGFDPLATLAITFKSGWDTAADVPPAILQAIRLTSLHLLSTARLDNALKRKNADVEVDIDPNYRHSVIAGIPKTALELLAPWVFGRSGVWG
jgi:hypothetical protein